MWPVMPWTATVDGTAVPCAPLDPGCVFNSVTLIAGTNHEEANLFGPWLVNLLPKVGGSNFLRAEAVWLVVSHLLNSTVVADFMKTYAVREDPERALRHFMRDYMFVCSTRAWLRAANAQKRGEGRALDTWEYMFNYTMDNGTLYQLLDNPHASEIQYVFGNSERWAFGKRWTLADKVISNNIGSYWAQGG
eukprot:gene13066-1459_t